MKRFDIENIHDEEMQIAMMIAAIEAANNNVNADVRVLSIREI